MKLPFPLPVEPERFLVVPIIDGVADATMVHLPAEYRERPATNGAGLIRVWFADRLELNHGIPPYEWPSECGVDGVVYAQGGPFEKPNVCAACKAAVEAWKVAA